MRPAYSYLLDTSAVVPGLEIRKVTHGHPAILYRIGPGFGAAPAWSANDTLVALHAARARLLINPRDVRALYTLGFIARRRAEYREARRYLERAAQLQPSDVATALLLGEVYMMSGEAARAANAYRQALGLEPTSVAAQVGLGWVALMEERPAEAARIWREVIGATRDDATLRRMVELYRSLGDAAAEAAARAALGRLEGGVPSGARP
jgi:cytochrome c-type biogenesis protein CcmH/NrfG